MIFSNLHRNILCHLALLVVAPTTGPPRLLQDGGPPPAPNPSKEMPEAVLEDSEGHDLSDESEEKEFERMKEDQRKSDEEDDSPDEGEDMEKVDYENLPEQKKKFHYDHAAALDAEVSEDGGSIDEDFEDEERIGCNLKGPIADVSMGFEIAEVAFSFEEASSSCLSIRECIGLTCQTNPKHKDKSCRIRWMEGRLYEVALFEHLNHSTYYKLCDGETWDKERRMVLPPSGFGADGVPVKQEHKKGDTTKPHKLKPTTPNAGEDPAMDIEGELKDFWAQQTLTFLCNARDSETFHETVNAPLKQKVIHGVFFSEYNEEQFESVAVSILDPEGKEIFNTGKRVDGTFKVEVKKPGTYSIVVNNDHFTQATWVTMMFGGYDMVQKHHIDHLHASTETLIKLVRGIQQQGMYLWERQNSGLHHINGVNLNTVGFRTFEFLVCAFMAALQVVYIKSLCSHRRII